MLGCSPAVFEASMGNLMGKIVLLAGAMMCAGPAPCAVEFCLSGEVDLGARGQGLRPAPGEFYPMRWCVITEADSSRVRFSSSGHVNPDAVSDFSVAYLPPERVRILTGPDAPDIDFVEAGSTAEALRHRRIDPRRLAEEVMGVIEEDASRESNEAREFELPGSERSVRVRMEDGRIVYLETRAALPLRGVVPVRWSWDWTEPNAPRLTIRLDDQPFFRGEGRWRELDVDESAGLWQPSGGAPREVPGREWPSRSDMRLETLARGVHRLRNVRTGFHHLVVETEPGLVVADAPAGWVELQQIPPADLAGSLGVSGLSEAMIDFLEAELDRSVHAVVLTHAHDDHAGGARAFAAAGARVYAPAGSAAFLERALNDPDLPEDRLARQGGRVEVHPVSAPISIGEMVRILPIGPNPHVSDALGVLAMEAGLLFQSDLHAPAGEAPRPGADRAAVECAFARWATTHLPQGTRVLSAHALAITPPERFRQYHASDRCRDANSDGS
jgi:hypothetical protein